MKLVPINTLFNISYGNKLDLNKMVLSGDGVSFVNRTAKNNGVVAVVERLPNVVPNAPGSLTIALGGSVLSTSLQVRPFYTGQNVAVAMPKVAMSESTLLYYAACIMENRFRYSTCGREANRTFRALLIPSIDEIPSWVHQTIIGQFESASKPMTATKTPIGLDGNQWRDFRYDEIFEIRKGYYNKKPPTSESGEIPFIGATELKNGVSGFVSMPDLKRFSRDGRILSDEALTRKLFPGKCITVSNDGSIGEAFYQASDFTCSHRESLHK